jgi:hypothetical protein
MREGERETYGAVKLIRPPGMELLLDMVAVTLLGFFNSWDSTKKDCRIFRVVVGKVGRFAF